MILTVLIQFFLIVAFGTTVEWEGKFSPFCPVETALRKIRMAAKASMINPNNEALYSALGNAVDILRRMGGIA